MSFVAFRIKNDLIDNVSEHVRTTIDSSAASLVRFGLYISLRLTKISEWTEGDENILPCWPSLMQALVTLL